MPYSYQIDIVKMTPYKSANKGIEQFLLIVDILSRKAFAYILPSGRMEDVMTKYVPFVDGHSERHKMIGVSGDDYFSATQFVQFHEERKLKLFTSVAKEDHAMRGGNKLGIIDRLVRTLKLYLEKRMASADDPKWTGFLDEIVKLYNSTPHSTLVTDEKPRRCLSPNEAYEDAEFLWSFMVNNQIYNDKLARKLNEGFEKGTKVRIALPRPLFQKEGQGFSKEIYEVLGSDHCGLLVKNSKGGTKKVMARECQKVVVPSEELPNTKVVGTRKRSRAIAVVAVEGVKAASIKDANSKKSVAERVKPRVKRGGEWYVGDGQPGPSRPSLRDREEMQEKSKIPYWMR